MKLLHPAIATACLLMATACEKHQEPIGTVPADDVSAVPVGDAAADAANCEAMVGAEREACLRRYPPTEAAPVEPQRNQPPGSDNQ